MVIHNTATQRDPSPSLSMKHFSLKASKVTQKRPKVVEWENRTNSRGTRYIPVDVTAPKRRRTARQDAGQIKESEEILHEAAPPSMDVEDTPWVEEPIMPEKKKRVSLSSRPSSASFDTCFSQRAPTSKNSFLEWAPTCIAFSTLRVFRL